MRVVVADTGPLQYLVLIEQIELLPKLYGGVIAPIAVHRELQHSAAPSMVKIWADAPPAWLTITPAPDTGDPQLSKARCCPMQREDRRPRPVRRMLPLRVAAHRDISEAIAPELYSMSLSG